MNGKQAKTIRKALDITKPTEATESGLFHTETPEGKQWVFKRRRNPQMNLYRHIKRLYKRGQLGK